MRPPQGVTRALPSPAGVITSAGVVLAATFSVLALMPIVFMMQLGILVGRRRAAGHVRRAYPSRPRTRDGRSPYP